MLEALQLIRMTRLYLKVTVLSFMVLSGVLMTICAQPLDNHVLRGLLMPENCTMPCFMGIRPGVTTVADAVTLLAGSGWVNQADIRVSTRFNVVRLEWYWNGLQPDIFDAD